LREIEEKLQSYFEDRTLDHSDGSFYRIFKPLLLEKGIFPSAAALKKDPSHYFQFQASLQSIAALPFGLNLALAFMVEVNVAGGILLHGNTEKAEKLLNEITSSHFILATGVSEPGWEGSLKKIKSILTEDRKLTGTKSFITNGGSADAILWIVPYQGTYCAFLVDLKTNQNHLTQERIFVPFLKAVSHLKLTSANYPLDNQDLVLSDYQKIGIELRLKEMFSLVTLLLGCIEGKGLLHRNTELKREWEALRNWRDSVCQKLVFPHFQEVLEEIFPFPVEPLLAQLTKHYELFQKEDLIQVDPDFAIFLWEDKLTKYLQLKKKSNTKDQ
jgi:hypothetical protein